MTRTKPSFKSVILAVFITILVPFAAFAQSERLDGLFSELQKAEGPAIARLEKEIWSEWSKSGSAAMDLLLERGRTAMAAGDMAAAIEHLTALTDHAPDFAEGWNARATAYFNAGLFGPSIEDIERTLALNSRHFGAIFGLAMIFERIGYPQEALKAYREVQAIHPNRPKLKETIERLEIEVGGTNL
ncbi:MAG: tetratricopeptide repeat protein [Marinosulfonomonas sp.]|nr:tetratricopeptide repeat protein [Marinosulfonomonas sp.]